jgi:hypothetical protein
MGTTVDVVPDSAVVVNKLDGAEQSDTSRSIRADSDDEGRKAFLASFSAEEDRAIRRKVDRRFLWLIGLIYILKNVSSLSPLRRFEELGSP